MSSWGNNDNAANAPYWAVASAPTMNNTASARPNAVNVALLYANTTPDAYVTGETIGLFGVDAQETGAGGSLVHQGWVVKTTGTGGRAGRVTQEVLVALSNVYKDGDGQLYPNVTIMLVGPSNASVLSNTLYANGASFVVYPTLTGNTSATLTYQWQTNNASGSAGWHNVGNTTKVHYVGATTSSLVVEPYDTTVTGNVFSVVVTAADQGVVVTSSNAAITVPA